MLIKISLLFSTVDQNFIRNKIFSLLKQNKKQGKRTKIISLLSFYLTANNNSHFAYTYLRRQVWHLKK